MLDVSLSLLKPEEMVASLYLQLVT